MSMRAPAWVAASRLSWTFALLICTPIPKWAPRSTVPSCVFTSTTAIEGRRPVRMRVMSSTGTRPPSIGPGTTARPLVKTVNAFTLPAKVMVHPSPTCTGACAPSGPATPAPAASASAGPARLTGPARPAAARWWRETRIPDGRAARRWRRPGSPRAPAGRDRHGRGRSRSGTP